MLPISSKTAMYALWIVSTLGATIYCTATKSPGEMALCLAAWAVSVGMISIMLVVFNRMARAAAPAQMQ